MAELVTWAGFRAHILLANDVVGSIQDDRPTFAGLEAADGVISRHGRPVLRIDRAGPRARTRVTVTALSAGVWLQEPGLTVKVAGGGNWRGYGRGGAWVTTTRGVDGWLALGKGQGIPQAFYSTVHFSRVRGSRFCMGAEYREGATRWRFGSDGGFTALLSEPEARVPWERCEVFSEGYPLAGVLPAPGAWLRRWELAGHPPDVGWLHFLGWAGGAGAVVNSQGRTPRPGSDVGPGDGFELLWDPRSWRELRKGASIAATATASWGGRRPA